MKMNRLLFFLSLLLILTGCSKDNPFVSKYNFDYFTPEEELELPMYFYATDNNGNIISEDILKYKEVTQKVIVTDLELTDVKDSDEVIISFRVNVTSLLENSISADYKGRINNVFHYAFPKLFDYYTGELYKNIEDKVQSDSEFLDPSNVADDKFKNNVIHYDDKDFNVGVYVQTITKTDKDYKAEKKDGINYYSSPVYGSVKVFIKVPKDYDGVMLAIEKDGSSKKVVYEYINNTKNYDKDKLYKLIDKDDELRKEYTEDSFYVMNLGNELNIRTSNNNLLIIIIVIIIFIALTISTLIFLLIKKRKKVSK